MAAAVDRLHQVASSIRKVLKADKKADVDEFQDALELTHFVLKHAPVSGISPRELSKLAAVADCFEIEVRQSGALTSRTRTQLEYINNAWCVQMINLVMRMHQEALDSRDTIASKQFLEELEALSFSDHFVTMQGSGDDVKDEAVLLWERHFVPYMSHVPADEFFLHVAALNRDAGVEVTKELEAALRSVLDPSESGVVSAARLGHLLCAFGPLSTIFRTAAVLFSQPWFHGFLSFQEANTILGRRSKGSFLCRFSSWAVNSLVTCTVMPDNAIQQAKIQSVENGKWRIDNKTFPSMSALVSTYSEIMKFPVLAPRLTPAQYYGLLSSSDCQRFLKGARQGTYLTRLSTSRPGDMVLAVSKGSDLVQIIVSYVHEDTPAPHFLLDGRKWGSLGELIRGNASMLQSPLPLLRSCAHDTLACPSLSSSAVADTLSALTQSLGRTLAQLHGTSALTTALERNPYAAGISFGEGGPATATAYGSLSTATATATAATGYGDTIDTGAGGWGGGQSVPSPSSQQPKPATAYETLSPSLHQAAPGAGGYLQDSGGQQGPPHNHSSSDYMLVSEGLDAPAPSSSASTYLPVPSKQPVGSSMGMSLSPGSISNNYALPVPSPSPTHAGPANRVEQWLEELGLLAACGDAFRAEDLDDLDAVATLTRTDLEEMGIRTKGTQVKLLKAIGQLAGGDSVEVEKWLHERGLKGCLEGLRTAGVTSVDSLLSSDPKELGNLTKGLITRGSFAKLSKAITAAKLSGSSSSTNVGSGVQSHMFVSDVSIKVKVGQGYFGVVYKGSWQDAIDVALKQVTKDDEEGVKEFEDEVGMLLTLRHPNVIRFYGIYAPQRSSLRQSSDSALSFSQLDEMYMVLEWANAGSLQDYVCSRDLSTKELVAMCVDSARGMMYLAERSPPIVHRDLAMRNLLASEEGSRLVIKVADFGLSRFTTEVETEEEDSAMAMYCPVKHRKPLPVRWLAPEAWYQKQFSSKSDVWAFGITMWEMFTCGQKPYQGLKDSQVMKEVANGLRPSQPSLCPDDIYAVMETCWHESPAKRPTFRELYVRLRQALELMNETCSTPVMTGSYEDLDDCLDGDGYL